MLLMDSCVLNFFAAISILAVLFYTFMRYKHTYWQRKGIPSPPAHWFFGHMKDAFLMRTPAGIHLGNLHRGAPENNDVVGIYIFHMPFLLLRNPELIKQILIKDFDYFPNRYFSPNSVKDKIASSNLFSMNNPEWKYLRIKLTPGFTSGKLKKLFNLMVETADSMKDYLQDQFKDGSETKEILVKDTANKFTTDIISSLAFGVRINSFAASEPEFFKKSRAISQITILRAIRFFLIFFFPSSAKYIGGKMLNTATDYFRYVFWDSMDTREASKNKRGDLIDTLIELKNDKQDNQFKFEGDVLLSQSAIFFVAGRETNITTMTFALYELAKHPEIQDRLRREINEKLETYGMTYEGVQEMKYLNQVISEVLRMYPSAPIIDRVADRDYKLPGTDVVIEKGTPVYVALQGLHYDPKYHPNPRTFDPDRFSEERKADMLQCTYMPFGEGPRICIGLRLGMLQSSVGLITMIKNYEVSLNPLYKCEVDRRNVFTSPPDGFKLNFKKIT